MSIFTLKVTPEVMKNKADIMEKQVENIEKHWNDIKKTVNNSKFYWEGDASDIHRKYITDIEEEVNDVIKRLKEHPRDLLTMANLYDSTEEKIIQQTTSLPDDVIV